MIDEWLSFGAAALRTRDASGISLAMYGAFTLGIALWLAYGIRIGAWPLIVANAVTLVLAGAVLVMKIRIERQRRRSRQG